MRQYKASKVPSKQTLVSVEVYFLNVISMGIGINSVDAQNLPCVFRSYYMLILCEDVTAFALYHTRGASVHAY